MAKIKLSERKEEKTLIKLSPKKDFRPPTPLEPKPIDPKAGLLYARCYADEKRTFDQWRKGEPREWKRVEKFNDIALVVPDGIIVLDFDDPDDISRAHAIIKEKGLKCRMVESHTGSLHAYFKSPIRSEKTTKQLLHCGLTCDWQSGVRGATAMVRLDGRDYKVLQDIPVFDTCELPRYFEKAGSKQPQFLHMKEGSRNDSIFRHIWRLQTMGLTKSEVTETIHIINDHMLGDKYTEDELSEILRDDAFKTEESINSELFFTEDGKFQHHLFSRELVNRHHIITLHGITYIYHKSKGIFVEDADSKWMEKQVIKVFPTSKDYHRREVIKYIRAISSVTEQDHRKIEGDDQYIVNVRNGRLNLRTGAIMPHTPTAMDFQQCPVTYDPKVTDENVEAVLERVFDGDGELIDLFEEIMGYCFMRTSKWDKFFILYGTGGNGKSTIEAMMQAPIGVNNLAGLKLHNFEERFDSSALFGKLANFGDDISGNRMKDPSLLKSVVSGERIMVERKFKDPFLMEPYCTLVFSANRIPNIADNSHGLKRRMVIVPFNVKFSEDDENWNASVGEDLVSEQAKSALLNMAIRGAQRLIKSGGRFTKPEKSLEAMEEYISQNSYVEAWIREEMLDASWFLDKTLQDVFDDFRAWENRSGVKNQTGKIRLNRDIQEHFGLIYDKKRFGDKTKNVFMFQSA